MQNVVPSGSGIPTHIESIAVRSLATSLETRHAHYLDEVKRLITAGLSVMARTGNLDPRVIDIVREAGLSNQAFYRHFRSKDELLLAILDDGNRRLLQVLRTRLERANSGAERARCWINVILDQARNVNAAAATRPFAVGGARLADAFPFESARMADELRAPLRSALAECGSPDPSLDAIAIAHMVMGSMNEHLVARTKPSSTEAERLVELALRGVESNSEKGRTNGT